MARRHSRHVRSRSSGFRAADSELQFDKSVEWWHNLKVTEVAMVEIGEVKQAFVQISALEEERDGYKREAKRCQEDIDAIYLALRRKVTAPQEQMELRAVPASEAE